MIRERNDRSTNSEDHGGMNFTVRKCDFLCLFRVKVTQMHRYHSSLFFFYIKEFNQTFLTKSFEGPLATIVRALFLKQLLNVQFAHLNLIVLYDVERSLDSTSVGAESDFLSCKVPKNRYLPFDSAVSSQRYKVLIQLISIASKSNPVSINENFSLLLV